MDWLRRSARHRLAGRRSPSALVACVARTAGRAGPREQAKRMHDRLVGVPPRDGGADLDGGVDRGRQSARRGQHRDGRTRSSTVSALKNFATPWTNVPQTVFADLNDYTATVIGMIRDDVPFDQVLSARHGLHGAPGVGRHGYSQTDNLHYQQLEQKRVGSVRSRTCSSRACSRRCPARC